jgi:hypothetical protein
MYFQTARYILKSYLLHTNKNKPLARSVAYLAQFPQLTRLRFEGKQPWSIDDLETLLVRALSHVIGVVSFKLAEKGPTKSEKEEKVGLRMQELAQLHGVYTMVSQFSQTIDQCDKLELKPLLQELCRLFAVSQIQRLA